MKNWIFLVLLFPIVALGQYDFDTRYFTINSESLPVVAEISNFTKDSDLVSKFSLNAAPSVVDNAVPSFKISTENYRQPVEMAVAVTEINRFVNTKIEVTPINAEVYGFSSYSGYRADKATGVQNTVYKEQKGLNFLNSCPPVGICPRCAPYKVGRGY